MDLIIWAFSGIGLSILGLIFKKIFYKREKSKQVQRSGKHSNNYQSMSGDIIINSEKETEKNETNTNYFSHRDNDKVDFELIVFEKLMKCNKDLGYHLEVARSPVTNESSKLSNYEDLNLLLEHIKDFRKEYYIVFSLLKDIDRQSNRLKINHKEYEQEKKWMDPSKKDSYANMIENLKGKLNEKIEGNDIVRYKNYLKKAEENFEAYFSNEKLSFRFK